MSFNNSMYKKIKEELNSEKVKILAVTKYVEIKEILQAYDAGIRDFAENKLQDAMRKKSQLPDYVIRDTAWHFIGHLQTNKVKDTVGNFEYIHSIDSLKLAILISKAALSRNLTQKVLIQVNTSNEESKYGFAKEKAKEAFKDILELDSIKVDGLMTMAPFTEDKNIVRKCFSELKNLKNYLQSEYKCTLPELSMGMSNDYRIAVKEGSTMIRLGSILFK